MRTIRKLIALLMVWVMLGSMMPVMAVETKETMVSEGNNACAGKPEFAVIYVKGLEKSLTLVNVLKDKEIETIRDFAHKKGYKTDLSRARISKIVSNVGQVLVVDIPYYTNGAKKLAGIIIVDDKAMMYELRIEDKTMVGGLYYVENEKIRYQPLSSEFLGCLWDCAGGLGGIAACGGSCAACARGGFWTCLACAACLGNAGCCVGECSHDEPWGPGFCSATHIACILGQPGACVVDMGCQGNCIF